MRDTILGFTVIIIGLIFFAAVIIGVQRTEEAECNKWATQAEKYPDYYITQWQADQCEYHGVEINAPVK